MIIYFLLSFGLVHLIYFLLLWRGIFKIQNAEPASDIPVSVLVCSRNEEQNLRELLPEVLRQHHNNFEIIVVDDRSDDGTYDYLLELSGANKQVKLVRVEQLPQHVNSKKYAITLGIKAAANDIILLTDADCRPSSEKWISKMMGPFEDEHVDFVLGASPYIYKKGLLNAFIRYEAWITAFFYLGMAAMGNPYMGVGRNLAYRKKVFLENGGFNKFIAITGGDDDLFVNRMAQGKNTRICIAPEAQTFSLPKLQWHAFLKQKLRHMAAGKHYKLGDQLLLGVFSLSLLSFWVGCIWLFFESNHLLLPIGFILLRTLLLVLLSYSSTKKLGFKLEIWAVPFLDIIYLFYYISTGLRALLAKRVQWN